MIYRNKWKSRKQHKINHEIHDNKINSSTEELRQLLELNWKLGEILRRV